MEGCWDCWGFIGHRVTELQKYRVTDTQGYSVYEWVKFFVPDFNKLPTRFARRGISFTYILNIQIVSWKNINLERIN